MKSRSAFHTRAYWVTWSILLALTLVMLAVDGLPIHRVVLVLVLLGAMLVKAALIGAHFMHLKWEKGLLILAVSAGILVTAAILFALIAVDGMRILRLSAH